MDNTIEKPKKNLGESIRQRLKNLSDQRHRPFDEILRYYAMERFLYRKKFNPIDETTNGIGSCPSYLINGEYGRLVSLTPTMLYAFLRAYFYFCLEKYIRSKNLDLLVREVNLKLIHEFFIWFSK